MRVGGVGSHSPITAQIPERLFSWRSPPYKMKQVHWASPSTAVPLEIVSVYLKYPLHKPPSFNFNYAAQFSGMWCVDMVVVSYDVFH